MTTTKWHLLGLFLLSLGCITPYLLPFTLLPRTEGFDYSVLPVILYSDQLFQNLSTYWNEGLALGIPWPIPHSMTHIPTVKLFSVLQPFTAIGLTMGLHIFIAGLYTWLTARRMEMSTLVAFTCSISVILAPALEYLYKSDAPGVFLTWCMLPVIVYYSYRLLDGRDEKPNTLNAIWLGTAVGYTLLNGHSGVFSSYLVALIVFGLVHPKTLASNFRLISFAVLIFILVSSDKLYMLYTETSYFPPETYRYQYGLETDIKNILWSSFIRPFFWVSLTEMTSTQQLITDYFGYNSFNRTLGFGSIFLIAIITFSRRCIKHADIYRLVVVFLLCVTLMFLPKEILPTEFSASWIFRDPANLFGILLAGKIVTLAMNSYTAKIICSLQLFVVISGGAAFVLFPYSIYSTAHHSISEYNKLADRTNENKFINLINNTLENKSTRVLLSSTAATHIENDEFVGEGGINNIMPLFDIDDLSFLTKGISLDQIHPAPSLPYGRITGQRLVRWRIQKGETGEWTTQDQDLLSLLSVGVVIATPDDLITASGLTKRSVLTSQSGKTLFFYSNSNFLPRISLYEAGTLPQLTQKRDADCRGQYLTCLNVAPLIKGFLPESLDITYSVSADSIEISLPPRDIDRVLIYSSMFRPGWKVSVENTDLEQVEDFHGLISFIVPAEATSATLYYQPSLQAALRRVSLLSIFLIILVGTYSGLTYGIKYLTNKRVLETSR